MSDERGYLLDNRKAEAGERFEMLSALFDPWTFRHLDDIGLDRGWRVWEVGAGGPALPTRLAERVGPEGHVLATDIDVSWLPERAAPNLEVRRHDVAADEPPAAEFDLVHARLLLVHVPERERALRAMVSALRPGGWLLVEDADPQLQPLACPDAAGPEAELANKLRASFRTLLAGRGAELAWGRQLPRRLRDAGLVDVRAYGYFPVTAPESARLEGATIRHVRDALIGSGEATAEEIDRHLATIEQGRLDVTIAPMISAWGRRPEH